MPSVSSPENICRGARHATVAGRLKTGLLNIFYLYDDLQGTQEITLHRPVQIMVGKSVATMGYLNREDTRRYLKSDTRASDFSKRQDMTEPDSRMQPPEPIVPSVVASDARTGA